MAAGARVAALAVTAGLVLATGMAACGLPHPGVSNGSVDVCYRAIPPAKAATHDGKAVVIGVHRIPADVVAGKLPANARAELTADGDTVVCAVSLKGTFSAGQVDQAQPDEHGSYAVVLLTSRHLHLLHSIVLNHIPRSLGGNTL
jgi:hypothetical protein